MDDVSWRKSSYSAENGGECVEVASWRKSSYSGENGGECVEVACSLGRVVAVRDSKDPYGSVLVITTDGWTSFVSKLAS